MRTVLLFGLMLIVDVLARSNNVLFIVGETTEACAYVLLILSVVADILDFFRVDK